MRGQEGSSRCRCHFRLGEFQSEDYPLHHPLSPRPLPRAPPAQLLPQPWLSPCPSCRLVRTLGIPLTRLQFECPIPSPFSLSPQPILTLLQPLRKGTISDAPVSCPRGLGCFSFYGQMPRPISVSLGPLPFPCRLTPAPLAPSAGRAVPLHVSLHLRQRHTSLGHLCSTSPERCRASWGGKRTWVAGTICANGRCYPTYPSGAEPWLC